MATVPSKTSELELLADLVAESSPEPAWDVLELFPPQGQWAEADYFRLNTNRLVELSNGTIEVLPMPTELHQDIVILICALLRAFVANDPLAKVLLSPFSIRLWPGKIRQPDVIYMSGANATRRRRSYWNGADLAVEVVSDDDRRRDVKIKRREYERAGISEYWIIDPKLAEVSVLTLTEKRYTVAGVYRAGDHALSVLLPGFGVDVDAIFPAT